VKISVRTGEPRTVDTVYRGIITRRTVVEEAEHEMTIIGNGAELMELMQRIQGMPGVPDMRQAAERLSLDPNFARQLDIV
jgi:hydroxyethylthiazole kinase-like sugar kinase family protein